MLTDIIIITMMIRINIQAINIIKAPIKDILVFIPMIIILLITIITNQDLYITTIIDIKNA